ncbi:Uncharacterised protein [Mycobacteroides abscessus subsp. abscessus]|nr:Uncharacterised protein [Mycobacteroides abscessus subsp. abscessus]
MRCTLTAPPRVTKPMISSPGTGVQHFASLATVPGAPGMRTPASPVTRCLLGVVEGVERSASSFSTSPMPPSWAMSRCTTWWAETWCSPTAV